MRQLLLAALLFVSAAACGSDDDPQTSPSAGGTRSPRTSSPAATRSAAGGQSPRANASLYIALGDSLSAGIVATNISTRSFVGLVHAGLSGDVELLNLGVPGHTSRDLIDRQLDRAVNEIEGRRNDADPDNDSLLSTLEIGGNDLLNLYFDLVVPGICPTVPESLEKPECVDALRNTLDAYRPNLELILERLKQADPELPVLVMTLYNPFSGKSANLDQIGELALEGAPDTPFPEGLNDVIRAEAAASGAVLVDLHPLFTGKGYEYIAQDLIHPNDTGYRVMADAVLAAAREAGLTQAGG